MKKHSILLTLFCLLCFSTTAQDYYPTILILTPNETDYDPVLLEKILQHEYETDWTKEEEEAFLREMEQSNKDDFGDNIRKMIVAETEFRRHGSFASKFTFIYQSMLVYFLFTNDFEPIVIPVHERSDGNTDQLQTLSEEYDVQWVINPLIMRTFKEDGNLFTAVTLQVYNNQTENIELKATYTGATTNHGFQFTCQDGSLECTLMNIFRLSIDDVLSTILKDYIDRVEQNGAPGNDGPVLILMEGRQLSMEELYTLNPDEIESIVVYRNPEDIRKYTSEDYEGVIIIHKKVNVE